MSAGVCVCVCAVSWCCVYIRRVRRQEDGCFDWRRIEGRDDALPLFSLAFHIRVPSYRLLSDINLAWSLLSRPAAAAAADHGCQSSLSLHVYVRLHVSVSFSVSSAFPGLTLFDHALRPLLRFYFLAFPPRHVTTQTPNTSPADVINKTRQTVATPENMMMNERLNQKGYGREGSEGSGKAGA